MTNQQNRISELFSCEFDRFVLPDLEVLSQIRPDEAGLRACAIPQMMLLFSILDLLGFLINPDPQASKSDTLANHQAMFSHDLGLFPAEYQQQGERIVKLFRHGIVHQFFPKATAVGKPSTVLPLFFESDGLTCLNVDRFTQDVLAAVAQLRRFVVEDQGRDVACRMSDRLDRMNAEDFDSLKRY